jgi:hypothetical protein
VGYAYSNGLAINEPCSSEAQAVDGAEHRTLLTDAKGIVVDICMF